MSSSRRRGAFALLVRVAVFAVVFLAITEVWFRVVMPACETPVNYQQDPATVFRFDPTGPTSGRYTEGRLCARRGHWRVNKAGWISSIDYSPATKRKEPMIAVLGDSYIASAYMDTDQHIDGYLRRMLPDSTAYAFGQAGWYLEEYVALSRYIRDEFGPRVLVIFVDDGDVTGSLKEDGTVSPFWWQISRQGDSYRELPPEAVYTGAGRKKQLAGKSALVRYLRYNCRLTLPGMPPPAPIPAPLAAGGSGSTTQDLVPPATFMVDRLCRENPGTPVVFVADNGARYLPLSEIRSTPLFAEGAAIQAACRGRSQVSFIDLRYVFSRDWSAHHIRFEAPDGAHWNAYANHVVAQAVAELIKRKGLLEAAAPVGRQTDCPSTDEGSHTEGCAQAKKNPTTTR